MQKSSLHVQWLTVASMVLLGSSALAQPDPQIAQAPPPWATQGAGPLHGAGPLQQVGPSQEGPLQGSGPSYGSGPLQSASPVQYAAPNGFGNLHPQQVGGPLLGATPYMPTALPSDYGALNGLVSQMMAGPNGKTPAALASIVNFATLPSQPGPPEYVPAETPSGRTFPPVILPGPLPQQFFNVTPPSQTQASPR